MAIHNDFLVASFSQGKLLYRYYPDCASDAFLYSDRVARAGVCWALSAKWIHRHKTHNGELPSQRIEWLMQEQNIVDAVQTQMFALLNVEADGLLTREIKAIIENPQSATRRQIQELNAHTDNLEEDFGDIDFCSKALSINGLTRKEVNIGNKYRSPTDIAHNITRIQIATTRVHTYNIISFFGNGGKGHSICSYQSGGSLRHSSHIYLFDANFGEFKVKSSQVTDFYKSFFNYYDELPNFGPIARFCVMKIR